MKASGVIVTWLVVCHVVLAADSEPTRDEVMAQMAPYRGDSMGGDRATLTGKVMCGYQGWFAAEGDGSQRGWRHYARSGRFQPGYCGIDLWPDVSDLDADEIYPTAFKHTDGQTAGVFSSFNRKTVLRHFEWMRTYGIDGVFVQRFGVETIHAKDLRHANTVLAHCREGANREGQSYVVMYDLSLLSAGGVQAVIDDWKLLVDKMQIGKDPCDAAYQKHNGKPVVAVWGIGFNDGRKYTLEECQRLISFLKHDPQYGGFTVMIGVPTGWRTLDLDAVRDEALHRIALGADIISPWTVGRYATPAAAEEYAQTRWKGDIEWCRQNDKEYMPVVFPGFSWHNSHQAAPLDQIPRLRGLFLWRQFVEAKRAGASMVYVAMFDEMDEGTAILKCSNNPPAGASQFVTFDGLPSDHYLWLTGMGGKLLRSDLPESHEPPLRNDERR